MVRRQREQSTTEDEIVIDTPPQKKHKRHKHKKHKKRKIEDDFDSDTSIDVAYEDAMDKPYKIKTKSGKDVPGTSAADLLKAQTMKSSSDSRRSMPGSSSSTPPKPSTSKKKKKGRDSGTSSEEERWLDAIKSGKLEEVDEELKKIKPKDPKMMTARQRAMYERGTDKEPLPGGEVLLALPSGYKEKVMTAEAIQKAALKSQKRKQMADEKREKDKKKTMDRLLKKQESKNLKNAQKGKPPKKIEPMIVYKNNNNEITLSLPVGVPFPMEQKVPVEPPPAVTCGVTGCENAKKYSCSKTGIPLCSLGCYKKNLETVST
ncbi:INO80 complex subunit B [Pectinophora gossypiella]|uniref:INO80 complex subunit B-like conserved region domain-containing protein n=1 Tax=Pectinophora gossypiella TaxID=13191 RepID=A0A1E1WM77_PECGO|nr:INO80 complex subunit B [Pectinophora gossypiella]XP_049866913.1 INO80 complex subunit B [Pectinophora gossypiella]